MKANCSGRELLQFARQELSLSVGYCNEEIKYKMASYLSCAAELKSTEEKDNKTYEKAVAFTNFLRDQLKSHLKYELHKYVGSDIKTLKDLLTEYNNYVRIDLRNVLAEFVPTLKCVPDDLASRVEAVFSDIAEDE